MLPKFPAFLSKLQKKYKCNRIVNLGDMANWHSLSYHERNPSLPGPAEEYRQTKKQIKLLTERFPKTDFITGNHDHLVERQAVTAGIFPELVKGYAEMWDLPKGWVVHPRFAEIEIDGVIYLHGDGNAKGGQYAAPRTAIARFQSVCMGHYHCDSGVFWYANTRDKVFGCAVGTGCDHKHLAQAYGRKFTKKPLVSAAVILDGLPLVIPMDL